MRGINSAHLLEEKEGDEWWTILTMLENVLCLSQDTTEQIQEKLDHLSCQSWI